MVPSAVGTAALPRRYQPSWLALLMLRVAETEVGDTWRNIRNELDRVHLFTMATSHGTVPPRS